MDEEKKRYRWPIVMLQGLPMAGLFTYVFGFIAINIHLGKFGIFEFNILSSWYVIGGILYIAFLVYPAHVRTRKSFGDMTRKLSDTSSHKSPQFLGTSSFRNPSMASQNSLKVA